MNALQAGTAKNLLTPDQLSGLNAMGPDFDGVHDDLFVRALVLDNGSERVALVSLDQLEVGRTVELRNEIETATGIPATHILIAATHSHNAPRAGQTPPGGLSRAPSAASLAQTPTTFAAIADTVAEAAEALVPAEIGIGTGSCTVNINRDELKDGQWGLGPNPDGPTDHSITALCVRNDAHEVLATTFIYAVHPTVSLGIALLSADIAGAATARVADALGGVSLWLPGAIGDQAPRDSVEVRRRNGEDPSPDTAFTLVTDLGAEIADAVIEAVQGITVWDVEPTLRATEATVAVATHRGEGLPPDMPQNDLPEAEVRVITVQIGALTVLGVGGEVTVNAATPLRDALANDHRAVVSIANERMGYLADPRAFELGQFAARGCPVQPEWVAMVAECVRTQQSDDQW